MIRKLKLESVEYRYRISGLPTSDPGAVQILVPVYLFNENSLRMAQVCIDSIKKTTPEPHDVWVIDNNSQERFKRSIRARGDIGLIENLVEPIDPTVSATLSVPALGRRIIRRVSGRQVRVQRENGAYANAVALEIGCAAIDSRASLVFTMHSDSLPLKEGWLSFLRSKLTPSVRAVSCWRDKLRVNALHIGGLLFDYSLFRSLDCSFLPNLNQSRFVDWPEYDVGDLISLKFRDAGLDLYSCDNSYNDPNLVENLADYHPLKYLNCDRCFDDSDEIFFAHLGRGTPIASGDYRREGRPTSREWIEFAKEYVPLRQGQGMPR